MRVFAGGAVALLAACSGSGPPSAVRVGSISPPSRTPSPGSPTLRSAPTPPPAAIKPASRGPFVLPNQWDPHGTLALIDNLGVFHAILTKRGPCAWLATPDGGYQPYMWPKGYRVRFMPTQLVNPRGQAVAQDGGQLSIDGEEGPLPVTTFCGARGTLAWFVDDTTRVHR